MARASGAAPSVRSGWPSRTSVGPTGRSPALRPLVRANNRAGTEGREETPVKAIVVTDAAAGMAGLTLTDRPEPPPAINDVIVQIHAAGFVSTELGWPSTWTDRAGRSRIPSIPGHELAG